MIDPRDQDGRARLLAALLVRAWADQVAAGAPYAGLDELVAAGERTIASSDDAQLDEALAPRDPDGADTGLRRADEGVDAALARGEEVYRQRFGRAFLPGDERSADDVAAELERRLKNDPGTEAAETRSVLARSAAARLRAAFGGEG